LSLLKNMFGLVSGRPTMGEWQFLCEANRVSGTAAT
jgi:hypothetical protein